MALAMGEEYIYLDGAGITAPGQGRRITRRGGARWELVGGVEVITEEIKIDLAGTYRQISDFIS